MSKNLHNIRQNHEVGHQCQGKLVSGNDSGGTNVAKVKIQIGIFQGSSLSQLLFFIVMNVARNLKNRKKNINHLMCLDDTNVFAKSEKELDTIKRTIRLYSRAIRMEFDLEKCS